MRETDLHGPVATWLTGQGYHVSAEVKHCDLVATTPGKPDDPPIILELKTRLTLDLVAQGVRRQEISPSVYLVVPLQGSRGTLRNGRNIIPLLRRLELGLVIVRFLKTRSRVEVVLHPRSPERRTSHRRRRAILREIDGRYAELNRGGQTTGEERFSAYRQRAIHVAALLRSIAPEAGSPAQLRALGSPADTQPILSRNVYGWFVRRRRGWYGLSDAGETALDRYGDLPERILKSRALDPAVTM